MLQISNLKLKLNQDKDNLKKQVVKTLKINEKDILSFEIHKESIDARKEVIFVYSVLVEVKNENKYLKYKNVQKYEKFTYKIPKTKSDKRPIVIGFGPTGIFAAYILAKANLKPIIFERGSDVDKRSQDVQKFWQKGILDEESNVQFGEGGAGTFSDGKLTTRVKDPRIDFILQTLVDHNANPNIKYMAHAHVGTDKLKDIVKSIRNEIIDLGGEVHFNTKVEDFKIENSKIVSVITNNKEYFSDDVVLAIGHSASDTLKKLNEKNVFMEAKDFAIGVRVEHPQELINKNQYKNNYNHPKLKASEYKLTYKPTTGHHVYSFCMCPGGFVVPSSSEKNTIVTNGMSYSNRANKRANSAILVQVKVDDYYKDNVFDGLKYQQNIEKLAFKLSNNSYKANTSNIKDFIDGRLNELIFEPSYHLGYQVIDFTKLFDKFIIDSLKEAFINFDNKIEGFIEKGIMIGPETRSSAVVRIKRADNLESINTKNLYPAGEGAGYSGGIISSFLDGIRVAEKILTKYNIQ